MKMSSSKLNLTPEQEKAVTCRNASILVSAAAGSGKTAVLVDRILGKVMDKDNPIDIDRFLVVTFTKAAAAQMRDKIASKIEKALLNDPENEHLMKQMQLVNRADIITIDSFCNKLVKEYFSVLNVDSNINIGDSGMMNLLKSDILDAYFEELYKNDYDSFSLLLDLFSNNGDDSELKDLIFKIYNIASGFPQPYKWLDNARDNLRIDDVDNAMKLGWVSKLFEAVIANAKDILKQAEHTKELCEMPGGPDKRLPNSESDIENIEHIVNAKDMKELYIALNSINFVRMTSCKGDEYDEDLLEQYKTERNGYKDSIKKLTEIVMSPEDIVAQIKHMAKYALPILDIVENFMKLFYEEKKKKKLMEFSDISHMAYELVCAGYDANGVAIPSEIGKVIAERYHEIYIDEYQDSNYLQEDILTSVSTIYKGIYNMFMVGDVKQSIYRFRNARPDLFLGKYDRFTENGNEVKIELKNNFRSRAIVLDAANFISYQIMGRDLGGIEYDENVALVPSGKFPAADEKTMPYISNSTELLVVDKGADDGISELTDEEQNMANIQLEANIIAKRIKEIIDTDSMQVVDEATGAYRNAEYRDIVILSRNIKGVGDVFYDVLTSQGIPVYLEETGGYFEAVEIKVIMSLLSVVDNCFQDIPLAAVLLSPIGKLNEDEIAKVCDYCDGLTTKLYNLYDKCEYYILDNQDEISAKLKKIIDIILELKELNHSMSISKLIWRALEMTGYYTYASAMPMGNRRRANINMLLEKAEQFEGGYYKGLFNFLRYIDKLKVNEVDFGEANTINDDANVVRIISMHKSKGLEYPIVFASGLGKQFNTRDNSARFIIHSDYYLVSKLLYEDGRYEKDSGIRKAISYLMKREAIAEEFRILYVAMTRAKEKLIFTGCVSDLAGTKSKLESLCVDDKILLPYSVRANAKSFMELVIASMTRYDELKKAFPGLNIVVKEYSLNDAVKLGVDNAVETKLGVAELIDRIHEEKIIDNKYLDAFSYEYPYIEYAKLKSKMSISEIKKMMAFDGQGFDIAENPEVEHDNIYDMEESDSIKENEILDAQDKLITDTKTEVFADSKLTGAERGTLVHKYMELFDFACEQDLDERKYLSMAKTFKKELIETGIFTVDEGYAINTLKVAKMLTSGLGQRMIAAALRNELYKEQQFSMGVNAAEKFDLEMKTDDIIILQGIIDAFFFESDGAVVMDYKTDRADEETLLGRYKAQLVNYGETVEKLTGKRIKELIIYSFYLDKEISIPLE